jgi:hypothetical protein
MLGVMDGKGGGAQTQQVQGQQPQGGIQANMGQGSAGMPNMGGGGLASMFANNAPAAGGGMPAAPLPQIMAPQRPNIQMPTPSPMPQQATPQSQNPFWYIGPQGKYIQAKPMSSDEAMKANFRINRNNRIGGR